MVRFWVTWLAGNHPSAVGSDGFGPGVDRCKSPRGPSSEKDEEISGRTGLIMKATVKAYAKDTYIYILILLMYIFNMICLGRHTHSFICGSV